MSAYVGTHCIVVTHQYVGPTLITDLGGGPRGLDDVGHEHSAVSFEASRR